jgi:predicted deacylase
VREPFDIAEHTVAAGTRARIELPIANLTSGTPVSLPVVVVHGRHPGPTVWLSAAVHGDELVGVEIIRRVLDDIQPRPLTGSILAMPVVNVHGFNTGDRYLPDRRDLNRSFPGSPRGSLASRLANLVMTEVVSRCGLGIDLHTGSDHRINLPQIRADLEDDATRQLAEVFGAPISLHSRSRDGSLREAATRAGATVLLYEAGEAFRFDRASIETGVAGVQRVLHHLGMLEDAPEPAATAFSASSHWLRAPRSGILHFHADLGATVAQRESVADIVDPFGRRLGQVRARAAGVVIGHTQHPLVNQGDAVAHVAKV